MGIELTKEDRLSIFKTFSSDNAHRQERVVVDLAKVARDIVAATEKCKNSDDDSEQGIIELSKFVDSMAALIEKAEVDEETLEVFSMQDVVDKASDAPTDAPAETEITDAGDEQPEEGDTSIEKGVVDSVQWSKDMAPALCAKKPVSKSEAEGAAADKKARANSRHASHVRCMS